MNDSSVNSGRNLSCVPQEQLQMSGLVLANLFPEECQQYMQLMFGKVFPILAAIVTTCNLTVVAVFLKPKIRSHTSFMLTLIALSDVLNIICPSFVYVYFYTFDSYTDPVPFNLCRPAYYFGNVFKDMFNTFSLWLTVLLAYIRTRCISSPFTACDVHNKRNISVSVSMIVVLVLIVDTPSLFIYDFNPIPVYSPSGHVTYETCHVNMSDFLGTCLLRKTHIWMEVLFSSFLPCTLLICLSLRMLISLKKAEKDRDSLQMFRPIFSGTVRQICNTKAADLTRKMTNCSQYAEGGKEKINHNDSKVNDDADKADDKHAREVLLSEKQTVKFNRRKEKHSGAFVLDFFRSKVRNGKRNRLQKSDSVRSRDSAYERLNRESRRTSWYILLVVTIICSHELPLAGLYCHTLLTHEGRLPPVLYGCSTMLILLWQYLTYSLIFLIYCCMCSAFRTELRKTLTCGGACKSIQSERNFGQCVFTDHCSVRNYLSKSRGNNSYCKRFIDNESESRSTV